MGLISLELSDVISSLIMRNFLLYGNGYVSLCIMEFKTLTLIIVGYRWLSLVIVDYRWLSLVIVGYRWLSLVIVGYHWLSLVIVGFSIDYFASFARALCY